MERNLQKALDLFLESLNATGVNDPKYNNIIALNSFYRENCKDMFGRPLPNGDYVRVVWKDDPYRDDGYYDINVDCCSTYGALMTVIKWIDKKF